MAINPNCDNVVVSSEFDNSTRLSTVSVSGRVLAVPGLADLSGVVIMVEYTPNNESGDSATQEIQTNADGSFQTTFTGTEEQVYQADLMLLRVADEFKANNPDVIAELDTAQCLGNRPADLTAPPAPPTPTSAPPAPPTPTSAPPAPPTPTSAPPAPPTPTSAPPAPPDEVGPPAPLIPPPGPAVPPAPPGLPAPPPDGPEFVPVLGV